MGFALLAWNMLVFTSRQPIILIQNTGQQTGQVLLGSYWWPHVDLMKSRSELHFSPNHSPIHLNDCELITFIPSVKCILGQYFPDSDVFGNTSVLVSTSSVYCVSHLQSLFSATYFSTPRRDNVYFLNRRHKS